MRSAGNENISQEEKLAKWLRDRENRQPNTHEKPRTTTGGDQQQQRRRRPTLKPLPSHDRRKSITPHSTCTPLLETTAGTHLKFTPLSTTSSSTTTTTNAREQRQQHNSQSTITKSSSLMRPTSATLSSRNHTLARRSSSGSNGRTSSPATPQQFTGISNRSKAASTKSTPLSLQLTPNNESILHSEPNNSAVVRSFSTEASFRNATTNGQAMVDDNAKSTPLSSLQHSTPNGTLHSGAQSSAASRGSQVAGFMRSTAASTRKSIGGSGTTTTGIGLASSITTKATSSSSRRPFSKISENNHHHNLSLATRRKSCGFLSKPPRRMSLLQQTQQSVCSSFEQLSDTQQQPSSIATQEWDEQDEEHEEPHDVTVSTITLSLPYLPSTSPLSIFSLDDSIAAKERTVLSYHRHAFEGDVEDDGMHSTDDKRETKSEKSTGGIGCNTSTRRRTDLDECEDVSDTLGDRQVRPSDTFRPKSIQPNEDQEDTSSSVLDEEENNSGELTTELPQLNAALEAFSNLDLSFNWDSSSDDEEVPLKCSRPSRDRSRVLGPILPIPSLRDDLGDDKKTQIQESGPTHDDKESNGCLSNVPPHPTLESPVIQTFAAIPVESLIEIAEDSSPAPSRLSRDRSRNLGLLLPVPSLRDDQTEDEIDIGEEPSALAPCAKINNQSSDFQSPEAGNMLLPVIEIDEESSPMRASRNSRDRNRNPGVLLPIPSLRDDSSPSDEKNCTPKSANSESVSIQDSQTNSTPSHLNINSTLSGAQVADACGDSSDRVDCKDEHATSAEKQMQLELCSPDLEIPSRRRRQRKSLIPGPNQLKQTSGVKKGRTAAPPLSSIAPNDTMELEQEKLPEDEADTLATKTSNQLDSIPLIKYKERHLLPVICEDVIDTTAVQALQDQLEHVMKEKRQLEERLARFNRSYEDRVTPFRTLFEEWREKQHRWKATQASHDTLVNEVQTKFAMALQLSMQKSQDLATQLEASKRRIDELESMHGANN